MYTRDVGCAEPLGSPWIGATVVASMLRPNVYRADVRHDAVLTKTWAS